MAEKHDMDMYLFHQGTDYEAYKYLGAHKVRTKKGVKTVFRVWAPNASAIFVTGDFNNWDESCPMKRITKQGIWEASLKLNFSNSDMLKYKYMIFNGMKCTFKADPFAFYAGTHKETASYLYELTPYFWSDEPWLAARKRAMYPTESTPPYSTPINIYEMHLGSFRRHKDGTYYTYEETADFAAPYLKKMGYTHVELLPIAEHPLDESWGYQICGFYAPTSRFGTPEQFRYFVNKMHAYGIGVIMDWVPAHFPKDEHGLYEFDGQPLYEYQGKDRMEHKVWGTRFFDLGRNEVQSFLISNALYWLKEYHLDGLRVDAVAAMLYLDFDRMPGEWVPSPDGSNKNYEAIAFFKKLNCAVFERFGDVLMIAEESTSWPMITKPVYLGGLGFNFKWNMGWMNDMTKYIGLDPIYRKTEHKCLTFSMMYSFTENFILPISHDEVVHGKKSLLDKMFGTYQQKFAGFRLFMTYMMCHPGKKLMFMGSEYGQFKEWNYDESLEWFMTGFEAHANTLRFTSEVNHFYLDNPQLWQRDLSWDGFKWIKADASDDNVSVFLRTDADGKSLLCVFNFSAAERKEYIIGVPERGLYREVFNTENTRYGGGGAVNLPIPSKPVPSDNFPYSINPDLQPLSAVIFECNKIKPIKK